LQESKGTRATGEVDLRKKPSKKHDKRSKTTRKGHWNRSCDVKRKRGRGQTRSRSTLENTNGSAQVSDGGKTGGSRCIATGGEKTMISENNNNEEGRIIAF